jgi:hypothetical protein
MDGFSGASALGGLLAQNSSLSAASWQPGRWDVFGTYADGTLAHWWKAPGTAAGNPETIGEGVVPAGGLSAAAWYADTLDVFGVGSDQTLQHWSYRGADPFAWESLGGQLAVAEDQQYAQPWGGPSAVWPGWTGDPSAPLGPPHVYAIGADGSLLRWILGADQPETITPLKPLAPLGGVSAVSWAVGRVDVFAAAADGTLQHWWADEANWQLLPAQVEDLGGTLAHSPPPDPTLPPSPAVASPLSAVSWAAGRLDVFGIGSDQTLQHWWYFFDQATESGSWCNGTGIPESLGGQITAAPVVASTRNVSASLDIFAPGTGSDSNPMLQYWWYRFDPATSSGGWNNGSPDPQSYFGALGQAQVGPPVTCISTAPNALDVFSCNQSGELLWWQSP